MLETTFSRYDELCVVLDIHMGGRPGFQILKESKRLASFICSLRQQRPAGCRSGSCEPKGTAGNDRLPWTW